MYYVCVCVYECVFVYSFASVEFIALAFCIICQKKFFPCERAFLKVLKVAEILAVRDKIKRLVRFGNLSRI